MQTDAQLNVAAVLGPGRFLRGRDDLYRGSFGS